MKTILVLMDSLNRRYLNAYGGSRARTPAIDRLAERGLVFENHYCASMPCMPARRDLMNGRYNFLEAPWGPLEPYDDCLPKELRGQRGVYSHMITDHYHYWEWYGMGYNVFYDTWEFVRGQEGDPWHPRVTDPVIPPYRGKNRRQDWINRATMDPERDEDYPTPQCFMRAVDFLDHNHDADNWFLHLEVFDPHEPFLSPERYRAAFDDTWNGDYVYDWPSYAALDQEKDDPDAVEHIRKCYCATLLMADTWLGKLLDTMDRYGLWDDTRLILTTDHGHLLGEHGYWAKNYMFDYRELAHIPLIMAGDGVPEGQRRSALTSTVDLMPTLLGRHGASPGPHVHGRSLEHLTSGDQGRHEDVLYGYFGKDINITDGRYTYCRQPREGSITHHHTAMATHAVPERNGERWKSAETGRFLPRTGMPVYRVALPSYRHENAPDFNPLFDLRSDPGQRSPVHDPALERRMAGRLKAALDRVGAAPCQYERMDLV